VTGIKFLLRGGPTDRAGVIWEMLAFVSTNKSSINVHDMTSVSQYTYHGADERTWPRRKSDSQSVQARHQAETAGITGLRQILLKASRYRLQLRWKHTAYYDQIIRADIGVIEQSLKEKGDQTDRSAPPCQILLRESIVCELEREAKQPFTKLVSRLQHSS